jgi:protoporphyrinogen oxidase
MRHGRATGVLLPSGESIDADVVVSTLAPWDLQVLLRSSGLAEMTEWKDLSRFEPSPILTLSLWLDREMTDNHFVRLHNKRFHWLFDNGRRLGGSRYSTPCYSLLISGPNSLMDCSKAELVEIALEDLVDLFPHARQARVLHATVSKQRRAAYAPYPGLEIFRPKPQTTVPGLYFAGDWTATGLPGTVESACRSAEAVVCLLA